MNFTQMHERLRLELLRRMQRGTLSVSLLARQTGFGQSHLSNFLHSRRQLSLDAMDRILAAQHMVAADLVPGHVGLLDDQENSIVPLVSHSAALFEPHIRPGAVQSLLQMPAGLLQSTRARGSKQRSTWQRYVAVSISTEDASAMDPVVLPNAIVLIDRHYISLAPYRSNRPNLYAVRHHAHLRLRYLDFICNRVILRPQNLAYPVDLIEPDPHESPADLIAGRVVLIQNEL